MLSIEFFECREHGEDRHDFERDAELVSLEIPLHVMQWNEDDIYDYDYLSHTKTAIVARFALMQWK